MKDLLWVEKYRPKELEDMVLTKENRERFMVFVEKRTLPQHLLLLGGPGSGKTTTARILIRKLNAESIEINASDERGIDMIRNTVKRFICLDSGDKPRLILLDEFDGVTRAGQEILRNVMEQYTDKVRFILSANYQAKIIEPIQSRCASIWFEKLPAREQVRISKKILELEKIEYNEDDLMYYAEHCEDDIRLLINELQKNSVTGKLERRDVRHGADVEAILDMVKKEKWQDLKKYIDGFQDTEEIYVFLYNQVFKYMNWQPLLKLVAEYSFRDSMVYNKSMNLMACLVEMHEYII